MSYAAPTREMLFVMKEIGGLDAVLQQPGHEEVDPDLVDAILGEADKFAVDVLAPLNQPGDRQGNRWEAGQVATADGFRHAYASFCEAGWHGMPAPTAFGGQGMPTLLSTAVLEMWKSANMAFSLCQMLTLGAVEAIAHHGTPALQQRYLPAMVAGRWTGTMNLTEPQAGSDLAALRTKAVPEGDHYRISGTKIFITWGEHDMAENIVHLVLARLPDAPPGVKGISLFLVPKFLVNDDGSLGARNDLVCASIEHKLGIRASATAVMSFGEGPGAVGWLLGEANQGLACMFTMMNHARLNVGLEGVAISERAYQQARAYALDRVQGKTLGREGEVNTTIVGHPDVRRMLMDMKARTEAQRALAYYTAGQMDRAHGHADADQRRLAQQTVDLLIPVVKGWCTEGAQLVTATGVQVHGGMGFIEETGAAQHQRDARITTIYEGTTGIQANDLIGRKLARDQGAVMSRLIVQVKGDAAALLRQPDPLLVSLGRALQRGVDALAEATAGLLAAPPREAAASAVPYLWLTGTVVGGWLMGRAADAATVQLGVGGDDAGFLQAKRVTALHFARHVLPQAPALCEAVVHGAPSTLGLHQDQF
ncbi:acyl-CoA dehydrogenase [Thauera aminoaromatica]|uniref:3-methylmercaptopropionyl-CoA dehydrogenase n=1 Tax=Thauera aminoaromatica TaxID=164330 RepID=A0A5C7SLR0_THASP|nr:acyl-CoA dehydrogenase [Thauera aminoaromatica]TXH84647.1 MAG: acyl-CoA dehydrogenase [Thauera aminoaromatica]